LKVQWPAVQARTSLSWESTRPRVRRNHRLELDGIDHRWPAMQPTTNGRNRTQSLRRYFWASSQLAISH